MRRREIENVDAILWCVSILPRGRCVKDDKECQKAEMHIPIELDMEASDSKLEGVKVLEGVESQPSYRRGAG
jgi:hypothetical protein